MSTGVSPEQIWLSDLNKDEKIQSQFDRATAVQFQDDRGTVLNQTILVPIVPPPVEE